MFIFVDAEMKLFRRSPPQSNAPPQQSWPEVVECNSFSASSLPLTNLEPFPDDERRVLDVQPALIVGVGNCGHEAIFELHQILSGVLDEFPEAWQLLVITDDTPRISRISSRVQWFSVEEEQRAGFGGRRAHLRAAFVEGSLTRFTNWLQYSLREFHRQGYAGANIFIVASLAEPIIGVIGDVLGQIQQVWKGQKFSVFLLLSASLSERGLEPEERFAALREILRFRYGNFHSFALHGQTRLTQTLRSSLVDYIFLFDPLVEGEDSPSQVIPQIMAEVLYLFNVQDLARNVQQSLQEIDLATKPDGSPLVAVNAVGVATLYVPVSVARNYIAFQLTDKVLSTWLVGNPSSYASSEIAYRWMVEGPCFHPFFEWLVTEKYPMPSGWSGDPQMLDRAFRTQLLHGISRQLNSLDEFASPDIVVKTLEWLEKQIERKRSNLNAMGDRRFNDILQGWRNLLRDLVSQMRAWVDLIWGTNGEKSSANPFKTDFLPEGRENLREALLEKKHLLETEFITSGNVRQALYNLDDIAQYYEDVFSGNNLAVQRIRQRLGWWIRPYRKGVEIRLLCVPGDKAGKEVLMEQISYSNAEWRKFLDDVVSLSFLQTKRVQEDLSGGSSNNYFWGRIERKIDFLVRAQEPALKYRRMQEPARIYRFLATPDLLKGQRFEEKIFGYGTWVRPVNIRDATRFTALSVITNLSVEDTDTYWNMARQYRHRKFLHIYTPERLAAQYEYQFQRESGREIFIHPEVIAFLSDPQLVTLFAQALFAGELIFRQDRNGNYIWLIPSYKDFADLELAQGQGFEGLWRAFTAFTVEKPFHEKIAYEFNPNNPFALSQRDEFLNSLHERLYLKRKQEGFPFCDPKILEWIESYSMHGKDPLRSLAAILKVELATPQWERWER